MNSSLASATWCCSAGLGLLSCTGCLEEQQPAMSGCETHSEAVDSNDTALGFSGVELLAQIEATRPTRVEWRKGYLESPSSDVSVTISRDAARFWQVQAVDDASPYCAEFPRLAVTVPLRLQTQDEEVVADGDVSFEASSLSTESTMLRAEPGSAAGARLDLSLGPAAQDQLQRALEEWGAACAEKSRVALVGGPWGGAEISLNFELTDCKPDSIVFWRGTMSAEGE